MIEKNEHLPNLNKGPEIKQKCEFFLEAFNLVNDYVCFVDESGNIKFANVSLLLKYGFTAEEIIGASIDKLFASDNKKSSVKSISDIEIGAGWQGKTIHKTKEGIEFSVVMKITPNLNSNAFLMVAYDNLTRETEVAELLTVEDKYEDLFLETNDAVYETTLDGQIMTMNPAGVKLFGFRREDDLKKLNLEQDLYINPDDRVKYFDRMRKNGKVKNIEIAYKNRHGEKVIVLETAKLVYDENGNPKHYRGILRDVTPDRLKEEQFGKLIRDLSQANKETYETKEELRKLNASKDKFFSIIAHDLKSPFNALLGLSDLMVEDIEDLTKEETKLFASRINKSAKNVFTLLENLLQWSRMQTGRMEYLPAKNDLYKMVEENISLLTANATKKNIHLVSEIPMESNVYIDQHMINTVIRNLISNAIKFTNPEGTIKISSVIKEGFFHVSVKDSGIGMDEDDRRKLFRIDVHHTTVGTENEVGTGLGLILCKELVNTNGGEISVESTKGKGTTFTFSIPAYLSDSKSQDKKNP